MALSRDLFEKILSGQRIATEEALQVYREATLHELAALATAMRYRHNPGRTVSFVIDRNVNYTDVCEVCCTFCAFHTPAGKGGYVLSKEAIEGKVRETLALGGTGVLIQGGVNPQLPWEYYLDLVRNLKALGLWVHGFSPVEIRKMVQLSGLGLRGTLHALASAGLGSLPGGGAEILVDQVRRRIAPKKGSAQDWLNVMEAAHEEGLKTTGTMMFGIGERLEDRLEHLRQLREQQDRALARGNGGGYTAFSAWPFQSRHTPLDGKWEKPTDVEYLRMIAWARLVLDNFPHIQSSWVTLGKKVGQLALHFGCDDMGSLMIEENVVRAAGTFNQLDLASLLHLIREAGFEPRQRDNVYGSPRGD